MKMAITICYLCMEPFGDQPCTRLNCGHTLHNSCIIQRCVDGSWTGCIICPRKATAPPTGPSGSPPRNRSTEKKLLPPQPPAGDPTPPGGGGGYPTPPGGRGSAPPPPADEPRPSATRTVCMVAGGALAAAALMPVVAPAALGVVGFGSSGVVGGTLAAAIHSSIGNVAAGSAFAICQSVGAGGAIPALWAGVAAAAGGSVGAAAAHANRQGETVCSICNEPVPREESTRLRCRHTFHRACILTAVAEGSWIKCPSC